MERRKLLGLFGLTAASAAFGLGNSSLRKAVASEGGSSWGYVGSGAPENWGQRSSAYRVCKTGLQQSPIDLHNAIGANLENIKIDYQPVPLSILNDGYTIQVNTAGENTIKLDGEVFELLQFHFHYPSEHTLDGKPYPMEVHFVHANTKGELAVLGVFFKEGTENAALAPVWQAIPAQKTEPKEIADVMVDIAELLPSDHNMYRYFGSLTTPPCSEIVKWVVFQKPITISTAQIAQFKKILPPSARPVQPLERRFVLQSN